MSKITQGRFTAKVRSDAGDFGPSLNGETIRKYLQEESLLAYKLNVERSNKLEFV